MKLKRIKKTSAQTLELSNGTIVLISYSTPVACFKPGDGWFKTNKKFSPTTSKHVNGWLRDNGISVEDTREREQDYFEELVS